MPLLFDAPPLQGASTNIHLNLILSETTVTVFATDGVGLSSFKLWWWAPKMHVCWNRACNGRSKSSKAVDFGTNRKCMCMSTKGKPVGRSERAVITARQTASLYLRSNHELFNCNNFNIHYWSWNYRGCWHQAATILIPEPKNRACNGRSKSSKAVDFGTNRKCMCNFLLVIDSNLGPILPHFKE